MTGYLTNPHDSFFKDLFSRQEAAHDFLKHYLPPETAIEYIQTVLRYHTAGTDKLNEADLKTIVFKLLEEGDNLMPTLAEQWIEEGREEGREATINMLRRYLTTRFDLPVDHFDPNFAQLDLAAIIQLSDLAFEVQTLAEFERALIDLQTTDTDAQSSPADPPSR